jgi:hypothetical protein
MISDDPFWTHDTFLFDGTFRYYRDKKLPVRGKLHVSEERYSNDGLELVKLKTRQGVRAYVMMHPYVIVPNLVTTVIVNPKQYADAGEMLGKTAGTRVEGFRDVQIGNAQAWYYPEDQVLVLWECFLASFVRDAPLGKDHNMVQLWTGFERWLLERYPETERIVTPWMDPLWQPKDYQAFLRRRGYKEGEPGTYTKLLR